MQTALMLHIATRLITDYRVDVEEVNELAQKLFHKILHSRNSFQINERWGNIHSTLNETKVHQDYVKKAEERMEKLYPSLRKESHEYELRFKSCLVIEKNKVQKRLVNQEISEFLDDNLDILSKKPSLRKKQSIHWPKIVILSF